MKGEIQEAKMVICPQCNIEHEEGEEFCRKCGSFLLAVEDPTPGEEKTKVKLICPRCQVLYRKGKYCRKCGSLLMQGIPSQETDVQPLEKKSVKRWSKEWLRLLKEEKELESCMSKLEAQRDRVSSNVLNPIFVRYKDRLESLSPLHQEIETELESIRKRASEEIDFLEKELDPIQKRLEEFQSLYQLDAVTKPDFVREKKELRKEIKSRERSLKKRRQILSLLPGKIGGSIVSPGLTGNLLRPFTLLIASVIILLMVAGGYFLWPQYSQPSRPILKAIPISPSPPPSPNRPPTAMEGQEVEKIKSLFENIRKANLQKNIDLFMSCFSRDFNGMEGKRLDTLKMWENYNYLDLSYDFKEQTISGDTANVRLEWLVRTSQKMGKQPREGRTVLDVTLKKEDGHWKIKEIRPVS
jgi:ribosomal protein L40E/ketosteroid isomerase-like protein